MLTAESFPSAESRAGEVLAVMEKNRGGWIARESRDSTSALQNERPPRLADIGITPKQSMHWQAEATVPDPELER